MTDYEIIVRNIHIGSLRDVLFKTGVRGISGMQEPAYFIKGNEGLRAFYSLSNKIFSKTIQRSYSLKEIHCALDTSILAHHGKKNISEKSVINHVQQSLPSLTKADDQKVFRNIHGIQTKKIKKLGGFTFRKGINVKKELSHKMRNSIELNRISDFVVTLEINSASQIRSLELADEAFSALENLFAFLVRSNDSGFEVRIIGPSKKNLLFHAVKSSKGSYSFGIQNRNFPHKSLDLDEPFFNDKIIIRLFDLISRTPANKIERKIRNAVIWIGKGVTSSEPIESIMNYCAAMESLLVRNEESIVSAGIMASLAEFSAFMLGHDTKSRKEIALLVKNIYAQRSAGTHGGKLVADGILEIEAHNISTALVYKMLELYPKPIGGLEDLLEHIEAIKYA